MGTTPTDEIKNHPLLKEIRQSFLQGQWHSACERCKVEESFGQKSGRNYALDRLEDPDYHARVLAHTQADGTIESKVFDTQEMDIRFGNKCNLRCRSCGPTDSTGWYTDWVRLGYHKFNDRGVVNELARTSEGRVYALKDNYNWYENIQFQDVLPQNIAGIRRIYFAGGEPLISKEHQIFLQALIDSGHSRSICLEYNTNLTVLPDSVLKLWEHFEFIGVGISMDGFGAYHEYLRYPGKFSVMEKNLQKLENCDLPLQAWIACTASLLNLAHLPDFLIWKEEQNFKRIANRADKAPISVHLLHRPAYLNLRSAPPAAKQWIAHKVQTGLERIHSHPGFAESRKFATAKMLQGLVKYMCSQDLSQAWPLHWHQTKSLDAVRGQSLAALEPELASLLDPESQVKACASP
jgi:hypothetical protein